MNKVDDTIPPESKTCTQCGEVKPATTEFYYWRRDKGHFTAACRECCKAKCTARAAANPDKVRAANAAWRAANPDRAREYGAAWRAANPNKMREYAAEWRAANPDRAREGERRYRAANPERVRANLAAWVAANPDKVRDGGARARARKRNAPVVETIDRAAVWERDGGKCHICGKRCDPKDWHLEHLVPLALGGEHSYRNVAVSHPVCNLRKGTHGPAQLRLGLGIAGRDSSPELSNGPLT